MELTFQPPLPPILTRWKTKYQDPTAVPHDFYDMDTMCVNCDKPWRSHSHAMCHSWGRQTEPLETTFQE